MIAGINKIWYQYYGSMISKGYSIGNNRIGLLFSTDWQLLNFTRGTAQFTSENSGIVYKHSVKYSNITPDAIDLDFAKKLHKKLLVLALELNDGSTVIIGVDNPLRVKFKYVSGQNAFDAIGYTVEMSSISKTSFENYVFPNNEISLIKYGLLYNNFALQRIGDDTPEIIPYNMASDGWDIPTKEMYEDLSTALGGISVASPKLRTIGTEFWMDDDYLIPGTNNVGFNSKGAGFRDFEIDGDFHALKYFQYIWTSTYESDVYPFIFYIDYSLNYISIFSTYKQFGFSARVARSASSNELNLSDGSLCNPYIGNDGKIYKTVKIGNLVWITENLSETKYRDGTYIPNVTDNAQWSALTTGACCAYNNDPANI